MRRTVLHLCSALALAAGLLASVLGTGAAAASPRSVVYDALGDSYAAGYGVPPYSGACQQSQSAYAVQLNGRMQIALDGFVACSGATTVTLVTGGQLNALDANTDLVTVSIGGNDIHFSAPIVACLLGSDAQCAGAIAATSATITNVLPGLLDTVYADIAAAAPNAHVLVTGYPRLFSPAYGDYLNASVAEQQALNDGADLLNGTIAARAAAHGFQFVDVARRFADHGMNSPEPWLNNLSDAAPLHPNSDGYTAYTAAVTAAIVPPRLP